MEDAAKEGKKQLDFENVEQLMPKVSEAMEEPVAQGSISDTAVENNGPDEPHGIDAFLNCITNISVIFFFSCYFHCES